MLYSVTIDINLSIQGGNSFVPEALSTRAQHDGVHASTPHTGRKRPGLWSCSAIPNPGHRGFRLQEPRTMPLQPLGRSGWCQKISLRIFAEQIHLENRVCIVEAYTRHREVLCQRAQRYTAALQDGRRLCNPGTKISLNMDILGFTVQFGHSRPQDCVCVIYSSRKRAFGGT